MAIIVVMLSSHAHSQQVECNANIDSTNYRIGDWIVVHLKVKAPKAYKVILPSPKDSVDGFEFVTQSNAEESEEGTHKIFSKNITFTKFDSGAYTIPPFVTTVYKPNDTTTYTFLSQSLSVIIKGIEIDTTQTFKDIKDVLHVSLTFWDYLLYFGIVVALAALGFFGYKYYKRRGEKPVKLEPEPVIPSHIIAIKALHELEEKHLWEKGADKEYQSELTEILRRYFEDRFHVPALEMTTNEIISHIIFTGIDQLLVEELNVILRCADMTKFAKYHPTSNEHQYALKVGYRFVDETKIEKSTSEETQKTDTHLIESNTVDAVKKETGNV